MMERQDPLSPDSPAVRVRDLRKRYGPIEAVRGVSFDVAPAEIYGLVGPNGAGKTTVLECILGLREPDAGTIEVAGINRLTDPALAGNLIGAQLQSVALQDKITPRQALKLFAAFYEEPAEVDELITRFGLTEKSDAPFASLSGGQQQRLSLALAFVHRPPVIVLDEPTAGLDASSRRDLHRVIAELRATGRTVLLSTHNLEEAHALCDRVAIIDQGRIVAIAAPTELISRTRATPRLIAGTTKPLGRETIMTFPGVTECDAREHGWSMATTDVTITLAALMKELERTGNSLLDIEIRRPSLEDAFIELTGRTWSEAGAQAKAPGIQIA